MDKPTNSRRRFLQQGLGGAVAASLLPGTAWSAAESVPPGYPDSYRAVIKEAKREGQLNILGTTDRLSAAPLVKAFEATFPDIRVTYADLNTRELDKKYRSESEGEAVTDVVWSSAMDTQFALIQDKLAQPYASVEARRLPSWAEWQSVAYAVTYEPIVFVYHRELFPEGESATTHAALGELVERHREKLKGKVVTLDIAKSSLALMLEAQDGLADPAHDRLLRALGATGMDFPFNNNDMLKLIGSGERLLGYNLLGSYADVYSRKHPQIGYVIPRDYALVVSRVMFMAARAPHPNAARIWMDFLLSKAGQTVMATQCGLGAVREDVDGPFTLKHMRTIPGLKLRPIGVSARLLDHLDPLRRLALIAKWRQRMGVTG